MKLGKCYLFQQNKEFWSITKLAIRPYLVKLSFVILNSGSMCLRNCLSRTWDKWKLYFFALLKLCFGPGQGLRQIEFNWPKVKVLSWGDGICFTKTSKNSLPELDFNLRRVWGQPLIYRVQTVPPIPFHLQAVAVLVHILFPRAQKTHQLSMQLIHSREKWKSYFILPSCLKNTIYYSNSVFASMQPQYTRKPTWTIQTINSQTSQPINKPTNKLLGLTTTN